MGADARAGITTLERRYASAGWTLDVDFSQQALDTVGIHQTGSEVLGGFRAAGDPKASAPRPADADNGPPRSPPGRRRRSRRWPAARSLPRAGGRGRARLAPRRRVHAREAAVGHGHDRLARAQLADLLDGVRAVLVVVELVADELLGLEHVRRDTSGSARTARRSGSPSVSTTVVTFSRRSSRIRKA